MPESGWRRGPDDSRGGGHREQETLRGGLISELIGKADIPEQQENIPEITFGNRGKQTLSIASPMSERLQSEDEL